MRFLLLACLLFLGPGAAMAEAPGPSRPFLASVFGDNMVLQQGKPNMLWGWAAPGETVRVEIAGRAATAVAGGDGRWQVQVEVPPAGRTCEVRVDGAQHRILRNVIVGDVWLCGGQSNMEFGLARARDGAREVAGADHPAMRLFVVKPHPAYSPVDSLEGAWKVCTPASVSEKGGFSAVAYFFGLRIQRETGVPLGLIQDCLGGTPAETWMAGATVSSRGDFKEPMAEVDRLREAKAPDYGNYIMHWYDAYDAGSKGATWADPALDDGGWKTVSVPGAFEALGLGDVPAVCWFRREVVLPDPVPPGGVTLRLGVVEKMDTAYVNGHWVGASSWVENPRVYHAGADVLRPGRNLLALRVFKLRSKSAFLGGPEALRLDVPGGASIPLAGDWKCKVSVDARPPHPLPLGYENYPIMPSVLFNGMIAPLTPFALRGAIWYQGEANASRAHQYRSLLPSMIADWRFAFGQGDFPFLIVQLPAFQARRDVPGADDWAELREAQAMTAQSVPNCDMVVTIDTGEADNIHPIEKKPVGERLAGVALSRWYGKSVPFRGPAYRSMEREGSAIRISFDFADGGLVSRGSGPAEFSVAGSDRKWHWAKAEIRGDTVAVSCPDVPDPVAVRYAWQANPNATLFNAAGLPAGPFRTDSWPGVTDLRAPW